LPYLPSRARQVAVLTVRYRVLAVGPAQHVVIAGGVTPGPATTSMHASPPLPL
jgi:hypothetical protein